LKTYKFYAKWKKPKAPGVQRGYSWTYGTLEYDIDGKGCKIERDPAKGLNYYEPYYAARAKGYIATKPFEFVNLSPQDFA
jgi:hypothetical protein